jgi:hypothetical protein
VSFEDLVSAFAAFRRKLAEKLRRVGRKADAASGGRALREAALGSLVENDTAVLKALVHLVERAQEDEARRREEHAALLERLAAIEAELRATRARLEALADRSARTG